MDDSKQKFTAFKALAIECAAFLTGTLLAQGAEQAISGVPHMDVPRAIATAVIATGLVYLYKKIAGGGSPIAAQASEAKEMEAGDIQARSAPKSKGPGSI